MNTHTETGVYTHIRSQVLTNTFTFRGKTHGGSYQIGLSLTAQQMESDFAVMTSAQAHQIKSFCLFVTHTQT